MKVERKDIDKLNASLTVTIEKSDYLPKFKEEIRKLQSSVQLKGFRKGKTPGSVIRRLYGQSVLAEAVNEALQKSIGDYIKETELKILGNPLPSEEEQEDIDFNPNDLQDFNFTFDIGLEPEFEVLGIDETTEFELLKVNIPDEHVDEHLDKARKSLGNQVEEENDIEEKDILLISAKELDGDAIKEKGFETGFTVIVEALADDVKEELLTRKKGDTFRFDIYKLEKDRSDDYVRKYLLNLGEDEETEPGNMFEGTIQTVKRLKIADLDQSFFDAYFGEEAVTSEEGAREKITENLQNFYDQQAFSLLQRDIMDSLIEKTEIDLPEAFVKRLYMSNTENETEEQTEKEFEAVSKSLKWSLIKNKLSKENNVEIEMTDIQGHFVSTVQRYMGQYGTPDMVENLVSRMMQDSQQVTKAYEEVGTIKLLEALREKVSKKEKEISLEEMEETMKKANEAAQSKAQ